MTKAIQEEPKMPASSWWTLEKIIDFLADYARKNMINSIISGVVVTIIVLTATGTPVSSITDKYFAQKQNESEQTYSLQLKTIELLEWKVMSRLDNIQNDINWLKQEVQYIKNDNAKLASRVDNLENGMAYIYQKLQLKY